MSITISDLLENVFSTEYRPALLEEVDEVLESLKGIHKKETWLYCIENTYISNESILILGEKGGAMIYIQYLTIDYYYLYLPEPPFILALSDMKGLFTLEKPFMFLVRSLFVFYFSDSGLYNKHTYDQMLSFYSDEFIRAYNNHILPLLEEVSNNYVNFSFTFRLSEKGETLFVQLLKNGSVVYKTEYSISLFINRKPSYSTIENKLDGIISHYKRIMYLKGVGQVIRGMSDSQVKHILHIKN